MEKSEVLPPMTNIFVDVVDSGKGMKITPMITSLSLSTFTSAHLNESVMATVEAMRDRVQKWVPSMLSIYESTIEI